MTVIASVRVSIHLIGRLSLRAITTASSSSAKTFSFDPKPPPTSGATTRNLSSGTPVTRPSTKRAMCGICVDE